MWHYSYGWDWFFPFSPLLWIVFWLVIIFLIFGRRHRWDHSHRDSQRDMDAEEVLADRFARGEIDEKEYEKRLEVLKKHKNK